MKFHLTYTTDINIIKSWANNGVTVNEAFYTNSLIVTKKHVVDDWQHASPSELVESDFDQALDLKPELIVLGTGKRLVFPDQKLIWAFQSRAIGFEVMDTGAACRTYNILAAEDRNVAAALIID